MEQVLTPQEVADHLQITVGRLATWRTQKTGPAYFKLGEGEKAAVRYRVSDIEKFIANRVVVFFPSVESAEAPGIEE